MASYSASSYSYNNYNNSSNDDVARVKERIDIVDVIGDKVRLRRVGRNYSGLCPFHNEKTPSFQVSPERQSYHCFGCGRGGDVFTFVMETEGIDFRACLELLAARAGIELSRRSNSRGTGVKAGDLYQVMSLAANFFNERLRSSEGAVGLGYMQRRSLTRQDGERFGLGWSPNAWDGLLRYLRANNVPDKLALDSGLVLTGQRGNLYDRFRGRLMFPIKDVTGRVIAFGGRLVDGEGAKYINSPEGEIYSKRRNLYLLHEARNSIREKKRAILVEGYMDALRLHLNGYTETVASLGTSLTEEQARLLKRFSDRCYICYDSDAAGQEATLRGMYILQNFGLDVHVITLPSGKDPDELLANPEPDPDTGMGPRDLFEQAITDARPLVLQHLYALGDKIAAPETRNAAIDSLMSGVAQLDDAVISQYQGDLAGALALYPGDFWDKVKAFRAKVPSPRNILLQTQMQNQAPTAEPEIGPETGLDMRNLKKTDVLEAALCALLCQNNNRDNCHRDHHAMVKILSLVSNNNVKEIAMALMMETPETLRARWLSLGEQWPLSLIALGDTFCDELERNPEAVKSRWGFSNSEMNLNAKVLDPWKIVCSALTYKYNFVRQQELNYKMRCGQATADEILELKRIGYQQGTRNN